MRCSQNPNVTGTEALAACRSSLDLSPWGLADLAAGFTVSEPIVSEFSVLSAFRAQGCQPIPREACRPSQLARQTRNTNTWLSLLTVHLFSLWYGWIQASIHLSEQGSLSKRRALARPRVHRSSQVLVLGDKNFFFEQESGLFVSLGSCLIFSIADPGFQTKALPLPPNFPRMWTGPHQLLLTHMTKWGHAVIPRPGRRDSR